MKAIISWGKNEMLLLVGNKFIPEIIPRHETGSTVLTWIAPTGVVRNHTLQHHHFIKAHGTKWRGNLQIFCL
jgi:hypothetical protein